jgi:lysophospholipase L1-like esterase
VFGQGNFNITEENIQKEIPRIDALAAEMKLGVIDMHAALKDKPEMIPDRVHPNAAGAGEMAKAAYKALTGKKAREHAAAK